MDVLLSLIEITNFVLRKSVSNMLHTITQRTEVWPYKILLWHTSKYPTFGLFERKQQLVLTKRELAKIKKQQVARTQRSSKRDTTSVKGKLERITA